MKLEKVGTVILILAIIQFLLVSAGLFTILYIVWRN